ncbi:MAG: pyridoxal phosphate-dependent aminotransferase [Bacteroidales bacterium]|jgi:aspartate aminotransferase|nr:pyridoxal phosphate-dependent aminotransferase [Bacteroidales bacterium]
MENISERVSSLAISQTLEMSQKSRDLQAQGVDVINLSVGEPDFNTPDHIKEAAIKAINENYSHYSPVPGFPSLLKAISDKLKRENNLDYSTDQIIVSNGAKHSLANVILSLVNKGDEVIVPAPYWVSYVELVKLAEGKNVIIETFIDTDFKITAEQLKEAITPKTKALFLCSPSNPSGSLYSKSELKAIAEVVANSGVDMYILSDEIYEHINFVGKHESIAQFDFIKDKVIIINGVSKGYAMTGWRIGYIAAPKWIAKACNKIQGQVTSGASSISQMASIAALNVETSNISDMVLAFKRRRDIVVKLTKEIDGFKVNEPEGAFYLFPEVSKYFGKSNGNITINDASDLSMYILNEAHVATVPGSAFGSPNYIRFSYATSDDKLKEALSRMKNALDKLKMIKIKNPV